MKHHKRPFLQPCVVILQWDADAVLNKEEQKKTSEILDAFHFESFFQFWTHTFCKNERKTTFETSTRLWVSHRGPSTYQWMGELSVFGSSPRSSPAGFVASSQWSGSYIVGPGGPSRLGSPHTHVHVRSDPLVSVHYPLWMKPLVFA